ncbi:DUF6412 domain-containing protein [Plantactinospora soyae]|uniref:Uncharacterized protein n=1 Tax=Plantactinospora soyae TaxID=1544732 RepID=A0A927QZ56_9ACTN|nr:DUF6412 domain-containing protein [Plantactinospora soyae]MBE1487243.1 hypothetical protein [Plantactinospora soyae]
MSRILPGLTSDRAYRLGWLAYLLGWAYALAQFGGPSGPGVESLAGAAVVAATSLLLVALASRLPLARGAAADRIRQGVTFRQRSRRVRMPRQLDPDAAGRPRPRAPSENPSAA